MNQTIRIIGGQYRGKKLTFPAIDNLRPTTDRVRETVFNWLMHDIRNAHCLDAFAGSGGLGFEAFSRGAAKVIMIELAPIAYQNLQRIAIEFNSPKLSIINQDANTYLQRCTEQFDVIFLDPPFSQDHISHCITIIQNSSILTKNGLVYLESAEKISLDPNHWEEVKLKKAGQVFYGLYRLIN